MRYSEANRLGDNCHRKDSLLPQFPRGGVTPHHAGPHRKPRVPQEAEREGELWTGALFVVSVGSSVRSRGSGLGIGGFEWFWWAVSLGAVSSCLVVWPWGDLQWVVTGSVRASWRR